MSKTKAQTITVEQADAIEGKILRAYRERDDYPPYALTAWDDRVRWTKYVIKLVREMVRGRVPSTPEGSDTGE